MSGTAETVTIDLKRIMEMIPHRYPMLLVDRVEQVEEGSAVGIKAVTMNEPFFQGHFPGHPVMPGVLIIEAMAQTAAVHAVHTMGADAEGKLVFFMSIDNAKFRKPVEPGVLLQLRVTQTQVRGPVRKYRGEAYVGNTKMAEADFAAMIANG